MGSIQKPITTAKIKELYKILGSPSQDYLKEILDNNSQKKFQNNETARNTILAFFGFLFAPYVDELVDINKNAQSSIFIILLICLVFFLYNLNIFSSISYISSSRDALKNYLGYNLLSNMLTKYP